MNVNGFKENNKLIITLFSSLNEMKNHKIMLSEILIFFHKTLDKTDAFELAIKSVLNHSLL